MKRKHKTYSKPKRPFDKSRIEEEAVLKKEFGLKNKREIWKANARINSMRERAKKLIPASAEEQKAFFEKLEKIGFEVKSIADVLSLEVKDYLKRRIQTILVEKKFTTTTKSARQLITHKKVMINGKVINTPSFIVPVSLENKISLKPQKKKPKKKEAKEEVTEEPKQDQAKEEGEEQ